MENINFLNEQNEAVYKKFIDFEHENLHKLDNCYSDTINPLLKIEDYSEQLDSYLGQNLVCCPFELEQNEEKSQKELIQDSYSHEEFVLLLIRTAYRAINKETKIYDSMVDDDLHEFEEDELS